VPQGAASGIQNFAFDIDGGPATASLFARPIAVGNFSRLFGSSFTGVARFIAGSFPVIWYQPNAVNPPFAVTLGDPKRLAVVATDNFVGFPGLETPPFQPPQVSSDPLLYQWQKNGVDIQGETLSYLDIESFGPADVGQYRVKIRNQQYLIVSEPVSVVMRNPFTNVLPETGLRVQGLIEPNSTLNGGLGGFISFTMSRLGVVSGTITLGNIGGRPYTVRFRGQYNYDTGLQVQIPRPNQSPLWLRLRTEWPSSSDALSDFTYAFVGEESQLSDNFNNFAPIVASNIPWSKAFPATEYAGSYNIGLETDPGALSQLVGPPGLEQPMVPQGFGFASMRVLPANGQARITGMLSDGTKVTATSAVGSGSGGGTVPMWIPLYRSRGALVGSLTMSPDPGSGNSVLAELRWTKPAGAPNSPGASGFTDVPVNSANGSGLYDPASVPASFILPLYFDDGAWAGLPGSLTGGAFFQDFTVSGGRGKADGDNPSSATFSFNTKTGAASGTFINADSPDSQGRPRKVSYRALALTGTGSPEFFGFFNMPNTARNADFLVGGSVTGTGN
jgi:hypothetical protein